MPYQKVKIQDNHVIHSSLCHIVSISFALFCCYTFTYILYKVLHMNRIILFMNYIYIIGKKLYIDSLIVLDDILLNR